MGGETSMSFRRRVANRLMDHACAVMPPGRSDWAQAMRAEFANIPDGSEALRWACGCVWTCYRERINPMEVFRKSFVRAAAVWLVIFGLFAVTLMIAPQKYLAAFYLLQAARKLSEYFAGIFVPLWAGELLIARFWSSPKWIFRKSLVRAAIVWLPLLLWRLITMVQFGLDHPLHHVSLAKILWSTAQFFSIIYAVIFVPLLICELLIARFWLSRPKLPE
jgi:hypothetical protein